MRWRLHHVNIATPNVRESAQFYRDILDMREISPDVVVGTSDASPLTVEERGHYGVGPEHLAWIISEEPNGGELHLYKPDGDVARRNGMYLNPLLTGHVAVEVDDLELVKRRLRERGIYFADAGEWALRGYNQIYVYDPSMTVIEISQRK